MRLLFALILSVALSDSVAGATERGTPEEARALLDRAVAHVRKVGLAAAKQDFMDPAGPFQDRDLYIYCIGPDNRVTVHAVTPALVGIDLVVIRDADGRRFAKIMAEQTRFKGSAVVSYKWTHPHTRKIEPKIAFSRMVDDEEFCAVGAYITEPRQE